MSQSSPFTIINQSGSSDWLLVCEHASNRIPSQLDNLGLSDGFLNRHIAYDIGAYEMTLALSKQLDATPLCVLLMPCY